MTTMNLKSTTWSKAYLAGLKDGLAWDLDGYASWEEVEDDTDGWDESTINAIGSENCAKAWGVPEEGPEWEQACDEYNAGAYRGACDREVSERIQPRAR